jgi:hypothetical protein
MTIRETIAIFISHLAPMTLVKQIFPANKSTVVYSQTSHESKPWMNVQEVELTAEDFA